MKENNIHELEIAQVSIEAQNLHAELMEQVMRTRLRADFCVPQPVEHVSLLDRMLAEVRSRNGSQPVSQAEIVPVTIVSREGRPKLSSLKQALARIEEKRSNEEKNR